jgi:hypothetical protein
MIGIAIAEIAFLPFGRECGIISCPGTANVGVAQLRQLLRRHVGNLVGGKPQPVSDRPTTATITLLRTVAPNPKAPPYSL